VPAGGRNGSRTAARGGKTAFFGGVVALALAACLNGNAEPIVRVDAAGADVGGAATTCDPDRTPLALFYRNLQGAATADGINFIFKLVNHTGAALPLSALAIRYYFTNELTTWQTAVYYADTCCAAPRTGFIGDVAVSVSALAGSATADHLLEVTFDAAAGALADGDSVQIEVGYFAPNHAQNLNQANDYSFVPAASGTQAEWDQCPSQCAAFHSCVMTVSRDGVLVWGTPP
jgi:hypothetical protein